MQQPSSSSLPPRHKEHDSNEWTAIDHRLLGKLSMKSSIMAKQLDIYKQAAFLVISDIGKQQKEYMVSVDSKYNWVAYNSLFSSTFIEIKTTLTVMNILKIMHTFYDRLKSIYEVNDTNIPSYEVIQTNFENTITSITTENRNDEVNQSSIPDNSNTQEVSKQQSSKSIPTQKQEHVNLLKVPQIIYILNNNLWPNYHSSVVQKYDTRKEAYQDIWDCIYLNLNSYQFHQRSLYLMTLICDKNFIPQGFDKKQTCETIFKLLSYNSNKKKKKKKTDVDTDDLDEIETIEEDEEDDEDEEVDGWNVMIHQVMDKTMKSKLFYYKARMICELTTHLTCLSKLNSNLVYTQAWELLSKGQELNQCYYIKIYKAHLIIHKGYIPNTCKTKDDAYEYASAILGSCNREYNQPDVYHKIVNDSSKRHKEVKDHAILVPSPFKKYDLMDIYIKYQNDKKKNALTHKPPLTSQSSLSSDIRVKEEIINNEKEEGEIDDDEDDNAIQSSNKRRRGDTTTSQEVDNSINESYTGLEQHSHLLKKHRGHEVTPRKSYHRVTKEDQAKMRVLDKKRVTQVGIAKEIGCSYSAAVGFLRGEGLYRTK